MSAEIGYDPFKADVWQMGTLLKRAAKVSFVNIYFTDIQLMIWIAGARV